MVFPVSDECRLTEIEARLRHRDPGYVRRYERITEFLLAPPGRGDPVPPDDSPLVCRPRRARIASGARAHPSTAGRPAAGKQSWSPVRLRVLRLCRALARGWRVGWPRILLCLSAALLIPLGIGATTSGGTVVCLLVAAGCLGGAGYRPARQLAARLHLRHRHPVRGRAGRPRPGGLAWRQEPS